MMLKTALFLGFIALALALPPPEEKPDKNFVATEWVPDTLPGGGVISRQISRSSEGQAQQQDSAADHPSSYQVNPGWVDVEQKKWRKLPPVQRPITDREVFIRWPRSPQGRFEGRFENSDRHGSKANVDYVHQVNKDLDVYASGRRDFSRNDNSGHVGVKLRF